MDIGIGELLIVLAIVVLIFGVGRISKIANELGRSVRAFREGLEGTGEDANEDEPPAEDGTA